MYIHVNVPNHTSAHNFGFVLNVQHCPACGIFCFIAKEMVPTSKKVNYHSSIDVTLPHMSLHVSLFSWVLACWQLGPIDLFLGRENDYVMIT